MCKVLWWSVSGSLLHNEEDDEEAIQSHLNELNKELKKKGAVDSDKITRLLSLTFHRRMLHGEARCYLYQQQHEFPLC